MLTSLVGNEDVLRVIMESDDWNRTKESLNIILGIIEDYILLKEALYEVNK